jgi:release factor glutamine methyltransferase
VNIAEALAHAGSLLAENGVPNARMDAAVLVKFVTGYDKTFQIAHPEIELIGSQEQILNDAVGRRTAREPLQYITGHQEFYGIDFEVTPDVLIPRPETEILVERAIEILKNTDQPRLCDIGTGSGCIIISILQNITDARALAVDVSLQAMEVARRNAGKIGVNNRLNLLVSDVFDSVVAEKFDVIVSNPPYVPETDLPGLQSEVRDHEPLLALTGGAKGLDIIGKLIEQSPEYLRASGTMLIEIGFNQSEKVEQMFDRSIWSDVEFVADLQGIPRIAVAVKH